MDNMRTFLKILRELHSTSAAFQAPGDVSFMAFPHTMLRGLKDSVGAWRYAHIVSPTWAGITSQVGKVSSV
jgi:hypothetical protein